MKRVLIITYYWPPVGGSGVQRWVKFAKNLPAEGWQPVIYTPENPETIATDTSLLDDIPAGTEVLKTHIFEPYGIYRKLSGAGGKAGGSEVNPINAGKKSWKKRLALWVRANFFVPDPRAFWVRPSASFLLKYLKEHPVDAIVSTGPPHSMHLIARKVSLATGIPWIADFRDPWTKMFFFKHLPLTGCNRKRQHILEKKVLDDATRIVAVSPRVADDFRKMTSTPVELVTNGFDEDDYKAPMPKEDDGCFRIAHTGLFAADGNPTVLWDVLDEKCHADAQFASKLRISLAGKVDAPVTGCIRSCALASCLEDLGYQPHNETVMLQRRATVLILPLRKEPEYASVLPGKIFEYLASRRPVIGIGAPDGAAADILRSSLAGESFDWDDREGLRQAIDKLWGDWKAGADLTRKGDIGQYERKATARQMAAILDNTQN